MESEESLTPDIHTYFRTIESKLKIDEVATLIKLSLTWRASFIFSNYTETLRQWGGNIVNHEESRLRFVQSTTNTPVETETSQLFASSVFTT